MRRWIIADMPAHLEDMCEIGVELHLNLKIDELIYEARDLQLLMETAIDCPRAGDDETALHPIPDVRIGEHVDGALMIHESRC
jgi:hypothetical protein